MDPLILLIIFFVSVLVGVITSMFWHRRGSSSGSVSHTRRRYPYQIAIGNGLRQHDSQLECRFNDVRSRSQVKATACSVGLPLRRPRSDYRSRNSSTDKPTLLTEVFRCGPRRQHAVMFLRRKDVDAVQSTGLRGAQYNRFQLDGSYTNAVTERIVTYQVRNPLLGLLSGFVAGNASGLLGIGGGIINVPVMTLGMRVPIKVATGTKAH